MERYDFQRQTVTTGYQSTHLYVLFGRAVTFSVIIAYLYVEQVQVMSLLTQTVYCHSRVYSS